MKDQLISFFLVAIVLISVGIVFHSILTAGPAAVDGIVELLIK